MDQTVDSWPSNVPQHTLQQEGDSNLKGFFGGEGEGGGGLCKFSEYLEKYIVHMIMVGSTVNAMNARLWLSDV